ncbi:hypothetical protein M422DRAFT_27806 [Sphaerobolus stellatus SS14]|nr:hypothetical protein M422DRAFT_27806 [Sphaerobolus stellatus SS14]
MPPATSRRPRHPRPPAPQQSNVQSVPDANEELFVDPLTGAPLSFYVEKDVADKDRIEQLITTHGGALLESYNSCPFILVDPHKESGQVLYRNSVGRKGRTVLDARWILECVRQGQLLTYKSNWAGYIVTGNEKATASPHPAPDDDTAARRASRPITSQSAAPPPPPSQSQPPPQPPPSASHPSIPAGPSSYVQTYYPPSHSGPWHEGSGIPPQATHIQHVMPQPARPPPNALWPPQPPAYPPLDSTSNNAPDYPDYTRYRADQDWPANEYYPDQSFAAPYDNSDNGYLEIDNNPTTSTSGPSNQPSAPAVTSPAEPGPSQPPRGRKRTRQSQSGPVNPSALVPPKGPPARSPTPPTRVLKSTYGGNLYTADDVEYLKKYIDYCQNQGHVLSLREICEKIALKAPHHTFYSWRRYCNKHQIRLGAYQMEPHERSPTPGPDGNEDEPVLDSSAAAATAAAFGSTNSSQKRNRSPTPPRALTRSTTGKGIAFTQEDVNFLLRFLEFRKSKEQEVDMVQFWKDVAERAPHHSRASWMKYWRRHKHELEPDENGQPQAAPLPEKKLRYSRDDDILLARYFATRPSGTSDQIFQAFSKMHPHHPWKGWQEHHRIHKKTVDQYVDMILNGQPIE